MEALFNAIEARSSSSGSLQITQQQDAFVSRPLDVQSSSEQGKGKRVCHICGRSYERGDHLNRHLKTHENARSYRCNLCPKRFNRADLLNRHQLNHARAPGRRTDTADKVSIACLACVASKCKCQDQKPCARCLKKNIPCEIASDQGQAQAGRPPISHSFTPRQTRFRSINNQGDGSSQLQDVPVEHSMNRDIPEEEQHPDVQQMRDDMGQNYTANATTSMYETEPVMLFEHDTNGFDSGFQQFPFINSDFQSYDNILGFIPRDSFFGNELDLSTWQLDPSEFEFLPDDGYVPGPANQTNSLGHSTEGEVSRSASKRYAAFERSPWLWKPTQNDHSLNDESNLNVEDNVSLTLTPSTPVASLAQFSSCCIDSRKRDEILHLLFSRAHHMPIRSVPPLALLNLAIRVYFAQARMNIDHLIHSASFNPKTAFPQLFLAIISAGANSISTPSIWKMGLVFQELVRHTVAELWEENNSYTRNLEVIQAFMISLDVGLWSGIKRTMEIAESFAQPITVMLRRMGAFSPAKGSSSPTPTSEDSEEILETKWETFIKRESFKRLVLHLFIHDTQASVGFQKPLLMSFTELHIDLPVSRDLWFAETASQWREVYLKKQFASVPIFSEVMHNPDALLSVEHQVDVKLSAMVMIHGYWGQIWRLIEAKRFYPSSKAAYRLSLMTEQAELYRDLVVMNTKLKVLCDNEPSLALLGEFFMMACHISPDDLQRFAGKYGVYESKNAFGDFRAWFRTPDSRMAAWHAGQVLRFAKSLMPTQLKGFYATIVYYAVLTLWVYGIMLLSPDGDEGSATMLHTPPSNTAFDSYTNVLLNEEKAINLETFNVSNQGVPGLMTPNREGDLEFTPLKYTNRILWYGGWLYKTNFLLTDEPLPPLLEKLGDLMRDLGSSPGSRNSELASEAQD